MSMFMLQISEFLLSKQRRERLRLETIKRRLASVQNWDPEIKWSHEMNISGVSYQAQVRSLFDVKPTRATRSVVASIEERAESSCGRWVYCEKVVPSGACLETLRGRARGTVMFDDEVWIPTLHEMTRGWSALPWMSLTPMEYMTLRPGTRLAKGHVIVAGLGLGHQLIEVSKRKQVTRLTLVERCESLVQFIYPRIEKYLGCPVEVVTGDAYDLLPKMHADVALVDIFPGYGGNKFVKCPGIAKVWCWGAA